MSQAARKQGVEASDGLMTRDEAAKWLRISYRQFTRLRKTIPAIPVGARESRYDVEDLKQWARERKLLGPSTSERTAKTTKSTSATPANDTVSPRAAEILQRLKSKRQGSTPKLYPVGEPRSSKAKPEE